RAGPPPRGADVVGRLQVAVGVGGAPDARAGRGSQTAKSPDDGPGSGAVLRPLRGLRGPADPRRTLRTVAAAPCADGGADDRVDDGNRRVLRFRLPPRDARTTALPRTLG